MMNTKKMSTQILSCVLAAGLLTACGHTHSAADGWERNAKEHWQICECGESVNTAAHTLDENNVCTGCGSEIQDFGDFMDVSTYTEQGDPLHMTSYDADGNVLSDMRYEYEYDADGNKLSHKYYGDGVLMEEAEYEAGVPTQYTNYYEDGTKSVSDYDEDGNAVSTAYYDADGKVYSETQSEYAYTADGESYETKNTMTDMDGAVYISEFNEQGDQIAWICYDPDGNLMTEERYEYEYDDEGNTLAKKIYVSGALSQELLYTTVTDADGWMSYPGTVIDYFDDGSKTVTEYNENDEIISIMTYDAAGNEIAAG